MNPATAAAAPAFRVLPPVLLALAFVLLALPRAWYHDDVFITYRYARHIAEGHGHVWNSHGGEPIEGATSLAWTFANALAIRLGADPLRFSHGLGLLSGALVVLWVARAGRKDLGWTAALALLPPALLVPSRAFVLQAVSGMELRTFTLVALLATLLLARERRGGGVALSGLAFLAASLLRPEAPLLHAAAGAGLVLADGRAGARTALRSGAVHLAGLLLLTAARLAYFGDVVPNTFHAKVGGIQLGTGSRFLLEFLLQTSGWLWLPVLAAGLAAAWPVSWPLRGRSPLLAALACQVLAWCAWIGIEGGDMWEFRLLDPVLPPLALLLGASVHALRRAGLSPARALVLSLLLVGSQALTLLLPFRAFAMVASAEHHRAVADFVLAQGRALAPYLGPEDRLATGWAGAIPYVTDAWHLDTWGLNDREIARRPFDREGTLYHQRHATWDDLAAREILIADAFNRLLFPTADVPGFKPEPWIRAGEPIYVAKLADPDPLYLVFASTRSREEVMRWLAARRLELVRVEPLAATEGD